MNNKILVFSILILSAFSSFAQQEKPIVEEEVPVFEDSSIGKKAVKSMYNYNRGEKLPNRLEDYEGLKRLTIYHIGDNEFPVVFSELKELKTLTISSEHLEQIPEVIGDLANLESLEIKVDVLRSIPKSIGKLKNLKSLRINCLKSGLERLPDEIGGLSSLEKLYIRSESLSELPDVFSQLNSLKSVELKKARITELPASFYQLKKLEKLYVSFCSSFVELSDDISGLSELKYLSIHETALKSLPKGIEDLEKLKELSVTPLYISLSILLDFSKLQNLESLYFKSVKNPEVLLDSICSARLSKLKSIGLRATESFSIKKNLNNLIALEKMSFRSSIPRIEEEINNLTKILFFDIRNGFENFSTIKKITSLESIVFTKSTYSEEDLTGCIKDLAEMKNLKAISLANNDLKEFPLLLLTLENLADLNVIGNEITSIPKEIRFDKNFRKITFGGVQKGNIGKDALDELKKQNPRVIVW